MKKVIVMGASSAIGKALIRELARKKVSIICCGRDLDSIQKIAADVSIRFRVETQFFHFDAMKLTKHEALMKKIKNKNPDVDGFILLYGSLAENDGIHLEVRELDTLVDVNFKSVVSVMNSFVKIFGPTNKTIATVSSIAGERGKKKNLVYNATKSAVSVYLQGLRKLLTKSYVTDIKPGWIDTPMTYGKIHSKLIVSRERVAKEIVKGLLMKKTTIYAPKFWKYIMFVLRNLPEKVYQKLPI